MNRETCKGCVHHRAFGDGRHEKYCNYILDTGEPWGCPAEKCTRYTNSHDRRNNDKNNEEEQEMPKGKKTPPEKVAEIKALRSDGKTCSEIAAAVNVSQHTVARVCQKEKEPAPTDIGTSSKNNNHDISITDNPGNVNTPAEIPEIVLEVLTDTLEDLYCHKREITEVIENLINRLDMERVHFNDTLEKIAELKKYIHRIGYGDVLTAMDAAEKEVDA